VWLLQACGGGNERNPQAVVQALYKMEFITEAGKAELNKVLSGEASAIGLGSNGIADSLEVPSSKDALLDLMFEVEALAQVENPHQATYKSFLGKRWVEMIMKPEKWATLDKEAKQAFKAKYLRLSIDIQNTHIWAELIRNDLDDWIHEEGYLSMYLFEYIRQREAYYQGPQ